MKRRRSAELRYLRLPVDPYRLIPARACSRIATSAGNKWPIVFQHEKTPMVQQKACSRQKSKPVFVQSFLACFKSLSAYLKHYRPFCCTEYIKTKHPIRKSKPPNFSHSVIYLRRLWAIPFVVILATGVGPKDTSAQNNAPAATSTPSADDAFRKGFEAFQRKDFSQALISLRQAADQGDGRAQTMLGLMYRDGDGARQ